jgi:KipI family sensor histidine kinase inhibitor
VPRVEVRSVGPGVTLVDADSARTAGLVADGLQAMASPDVVSVCRGATTVVIEHARSLPHADVCALLREVAQRAADRSHQPQAAPLELPVVYDGEDLADVALATGLTAEEVIALHCGATYTVAFVGFGAGFGYLTGLHPRLHLPRRAVPRPWVPAGAVAIAMGYTGVYPRATPGGWHLLGRTDAAIWDPTREPPGLFLPGRRVRFVPVVGPS